MDHQYHRKSIRLEGYDYTQAGAYFITIVTANRVVRFGSILDGEMQMNLVGQMVLREWQRLPGRFSGLEVDLFVIMPNHIHGILRIKSRDLSRDLENSLPIHNTGLAPHVVAGSVGAVVRAFKSSTTLHYHRMRGTDPDPLWQRNYYEHILRNDQEWDRVRRYILNNPFEWDRDPANPGR